MKPCVINLRLFGGKGANQAVVATRIKPILCFKFVNGSMVNKFLKFGRSKNVNVGLYTEDIDVATGFTTYVTASGGKMFNCGSAFGKLFF